MGDLVERDGLYYKKFSDVPFTGEIEGRVQGRFKNGKEEGLWIEYWSKGQLFSKGEYKNGEREGPWISYWDNGQLMEKGDFKNGKMEGSWVNYDDDGTLLKDFSGVWKDGVKISD